MFPLESKNSGRELWGTPPILTESRLFGITVFGDGATIKGVPLVNILAAGVNNPFALLDVADCTDRAAQAKKKDASYIASLVDPLIVKLENEIDGNKLCHNGIVDLVYFDLEFRILIYKH